MVNVYLVIKRYPDFDQVCSVYATRESAHEEKKRIEDSGPTEAEVVVESWTLHQ